MSQVKRSMETLARKNEQEEERKKEKASSDNRRIPFEDQEDLRDILMKKRGESGRGRSEKSIKRERKSRSPKSRSRSRSGRKNSRSCRRSRSRSRSRARSRSRQQSRRNGRKAARYLPHLRGREVYPAGEAGVELGGIAGMAKREGSKRKVEVR